MIELVGNHLWQSTLVAAAAALLTLAVRDSRAQVRYGLWLAASIKLLVPFAGLVAIGRQIGWRPSASMPENGLALVIEAASQPFSRPGFSSIGVTVPGSAEPGGSVLPLVMTTIWIAGVAVMLFTRWARWRRMAMLVRDAEPLEYGREVEAVRRLEAAIGMRNPIPVVASRASLEPGVFGILKPVLVWPRSIGPHLTDGQVEAIVAHELTHVRRRDNLASALHMAVETIFWFHPLVWWLGARLVEERSEPAMKTSSPSEASQRSTRRASSGRVSSAWSRRSRAWPASLGPI